MRALTAVVCLLVGLTTSITLVQAGERSPREKSRQGGEVIADAVAILQLNFQDGGDTSLLADDYDEACPDSSYSPDAVYRYTNDSGAERVLRIDLEGSYFDTKLYIYGQSERGFDLIECNDDRPDKADCGGGTSLIEDLPVEDGETIFIVVDGSHNAGGEYLIRVTDPYAGACCLPDGTCGFLNEAGCDVAGGDFRGAGSTCDPNPCPPPVGACCFRNASCRVLTGPHCVSLRGTFIGPDTDCDPNPCPPVAPRVE